MTSGEIRGDELSATGERPALGSSELYAEWAARMQRGRGRHAAISRNLSSWSNYKSWSEKMRVSFESDAPTTKK
jgi:hypothetical protein